MPEGPLGGPRPLAEGKLKYTVTVQCPMEIYRDPPLADDIIDMRVNTPQEDTISYIRKKTGKVILAANRLAHPSRINLTNQDVEEYKPGSAVPEDHVHFKWTYTISGKGVGKANDTGASSRDIVTLHQALINENDSAIESSSVQREYSPSPLSAERIWIHTD